jgi:arginyl-tRNA synthetase
MTDKKPKNDSVLKDDPKNQRDIFKDAVIELLAQAIPDLDKSLIEIPPDTKLGDYAFPCFTLSKQFRKSPNAIAEELAKKIVPNDYICKIQNNGPYINFFLNPERIAESTLSALIRQEQDFGKGSSKEKVMVEFSSPNTNKPLHLGHLRNICLGESVSRLIEFSGSKVIRACLVNDRGIHICKSMLMYDKHGKNKNPVDAGKKSDHYVGDFYVMFNNEANDNPNVEEEAKEMLRKWESGDKYVVELWKKMNKWANDGFSETYKVIGVKFDKFYLESDIYKHGKEIILDGLKRGIFIEEEKAIVADLEKFKLPKKVLIRSDGTSIYMTQDIYLAIKKFEDFGLDRSLYVVANEQNLHFQQLFKILEILEFEYAKKCYHLSYGMVNLPSGKMKSREGTVVDADNIIAELKELSMKEINARYKDITKKEADERAIKIGLAALKFFLLKMDPAKDMTFNPEESISFEGETGPYVQYTYARASSILRKYEKDISKLSSEVDFSLYNEYELRLIKHLASYSKTAAEASASFKPSIVCRYLLDLSQMFNEYYHSTPVLKAENEELIKARILVIASVREVIRSGFYLLGIDVLEEM